MEGKKNYKLEWNRNKNKKGGGSRKTEEKRKTTPGRITSSRGQKPEVMRKQRKSERGKGRKRKSYAKSKRIFEGEIFFHLRGIQRIHTRIHSIREREGRRKDEAVDAVAAEMFGSEVVEFA